MRILLVDDHTLFREAFQSILTQLDEKVAVLNASNANEARQLAMHYQELDLIIVDLALPDSRGIGILLSLIALSPTVPAIVLSATEDVAIVREAIAAGAAGYIPKSSSSHETLAAIRLVLDGECYIPPTMLAMFDAGATTAPSDNNDTNSTDNTIESLTARQLQVLTLIGQGMPNKVIARQLDLAEGTVKLHVAAILRVFNVSNRTQAVIEASRRGLIKATR